MMVNLSTESKPSITSQPEQFYLKTKHDHHKACFKQY